MYLYLLRGINLLGLIVIAAICVSCEKKYIEIVPVAVLEHDVSITNAGIIVHMAFLSEQLGYAADTTTIYKTENGGITWQAVTSPDPTGAISNLVFFDETHGLCLSEGKVYATANSGLTWTYKAEATFIGKSASGKGVYGYSAVVSGFIDGNYYFGRKCRVFVSINKGETFQHFANIDTDGYDVLHGFVTGDNVLVATWDTRYRNWLFGLNLETGDTGMGVGLYTGGFRVSEWPKDVYQHNGVKIVVALGVEYNSNANGEHIYDIHKRIGGYESVSVLGNLVVAAGKNSLLSNIEIGDGVFWHEMLQVDGQPFRQNFKKVQLVGHNSFYVSGENGLIWKMKY